MEHGSASLQDEWIRVHSAIEEVAAAILGEKIPIIRNDGFNREYQQVIESKKELRKTTQPVKQGKNWQINNKRGTS